MAKRIEAALALVALGALVAAGCGSSKPEYCSKVDDLNEAVSTLKSDVTGGNVSAVHSDVQKVNTAANAVADSARSDFPHQTKALESSIRTLSSAVQALPPSPGLNDVVPLLGNVTDVGTAVDNFKSATSSKCD
jgi:outer membrane murein-binding lipoprotein Lpp